MKRFFLPSPGIPPERPEMTLLEKIVYIADYIEPKRETKPLTSPVVRKLAFEDLDECMYEILARYTCLILRKIRKILIMLQKMPFYITKTYI